MKTAKEIRDKAELDILELQKVCKHEKTTLCHESWAPGHFTGRMLEVCDACEFVLGSEGGVQNVPVPEEG